ncbi:MAG: Pycsar system effector family protein [Ekhidna sp.]
MNKELLEVFKNVNDWLKFAEAKNAMLIALNGAILIGISKISDSVLFDFTPFFWTGYLSLAKVMLLFSMTVSLLSFVPRIKMKGGLYEPNSGSNRWFFEYLKTLAKEQIVEEITGQKPSRNQLEIDLAEQIRQNSLIASSKYSLFSIAIWLTVASVISIPIAGLFALYLYLS